MIHLDFCWTPCYLLVIHLLGYRELLYFGQLGVLLSFVTVTVSFFELKNYTLLISHASNRNGFCD